MERLEPTPFGLVNNNKDSDKIKKRKSKSSSPSFTDLLLGTNSSTPKKKTKRHSSIKRKSKTDSNVDWLMGYSGKSSKKRKPRSSSNVDKLWGMGSGNDFKC